MRLYEKNVDSFTRANGNSACADCLALLELARQGSKTVYVVKSWLGYEGDRLAIEKGDAQGTWSRRVSDPPTRKRFSTNKQG